MRTDNQYGYKNFMPPGRPKGLPKTGGRTKTRPPGSIPRIYHATPEEHEQLKAKLKELRKPQ